ncbi:MAG: hypothetical protein DHS20C18_49360 [Saprospiraceae bacterium]|nr:MAG: hypothetical protein DHS20C18_49360 [Saprospiraceae bacterium]
MLRPLLYELFETIRQYDRQTGHRALGFDSYLALIEALQAGIGFNSEEQLLQVCTLLWKKPHHEDVEFNNALKMAVREFYHNLRLSETAVQSKPADQLGVPDSTQRHIDDLPSGKKKNKGTGEEAKEQQDTPTSTEHTVIISFENARPNADATSIQVSEKALEKEISQYNFWLKGNYFEFSSRRLQQGLRALRSEVNSATKKEIDLPATIEATAKRGYFQELSWQKAKEWHSSLVVLIDNGHSMVAFQPMIDELIEVLRADTDQQLNIFYFDQAPVKHVFADKDHLKGITLEQFAAKFKSPMLILSDAGAARSGIDRQRLDQTVNLLKSLKNHRVAWLNPMPRKRWKRSTADYISYYVNMFDANALEFGNAVRILKAKLIGKKLLS